ncbi:MAG: hypothetical protein K9K82_14120 [Desulfobacteraceae bacterium]|nr:hypothetical protein [Desulfobacteraceae bacterium]
MKRLTAILVAGLFVLAPLSASAMEMMSDSNMKDVTGQAGVSIALDDVVLESWNGITKYTDTDGSQSETIDTDVTDGTAGDFVYTGDATQASVVISDQHTVQDFQAITHMDGSGNLVSPGMPLARSSFLDPDDGFLDAWTDVDTSVSDRYADLNFTPSALSIDVGTCQIMTRALQYKMNAANVALTGSGLLGGTDVESGYDGRTVAGVVIGLPTLEINTSASSQSIGIEQDGAHNTGRNFIKIEQGESTLHVLGGTVEIAPH